MIPIEKTLVSDDIALIRFCCDLPRCNGACCVAGDAGAPIDSEEIVLIQESLDDIIPFMTQKGVETINESGVFDYDAAGNYVTPLNEGKECAFAYFTGQIARCAIEKAWENKKITFRKPLSCHLYPIRITSYNGFDAVNYHKWSVCKQALLKGIQNNLPLYLFLKDPLIRKYGKAWYNELVETIALLHQKP